MTRTVTHHGHNRKVKSQRCIGRLVSGTVKFTAAANYRASISRGRLVYATGTSVPMSRGRSMLLLHRLRSVPAGRYTLTRKIRQGRRWTTRRTGIVIA